jgi:hypothetical protein
MRRDNPITGIAGCCERVHLTRRQGMHAGFEPTHVNNLHRVDAQRRPRIIDDAGSVLSRRLLLRVFKSVALAYGAATIAYL